MRDHLAIAFYFKRLGFGLREFGFPYQMAQSGDSGIQRVKLIRLPIEYRLHTVLFDLHLLGR